KGKDAITLVENPAGHEGMPELAVSAPIFSMSKKKAIGVLVNTIRLSELNKILSGEYRKELHSILLDKGRWKSMEVYLVNRDKRMLTNSIFVKDAVLKQIVNTLPVVTGLTTKKEVAEFYKDYRGVMVAGASKPIPQLEWILLTEIDEDEILSFMKLMLMSAPIPAGIIIIAGILLFITFFKTARMKAENTLEEQSCLTALSTDIGIALTQHGNLMDILQKCAESLVKNFDAAFARIWTFNKEANVLELQSSAGIYTHIDGPHSRIPVGMFKIGLIAEERKPILTNSVIGDPRVPDQEWARQTGMVSFAGYPLIVEDRLVGVMAIFAQKPLPEVTLKALAAVSDSIALGIERKQIEDEQKLLREQLYHSQKLESVGTLAGGIAHDFNNILAVIIGYGNLLEKSVEKNNSSQIYIQKILKSAERATHLTQGLLAFSRKQGSRQKPVSISRILLTVNNLLLRLIGENIVLDIIPANKDCVVMVDCGQMEQVLINLATNARDAMPNGGKLIIRADIIELGSEFIRTHGYGEIGAYVRISVTDTGIGMDKETQRRIFQPFFTTKEVGKGTGLGLSIVYGIIKTHGGYINVESEPGKGATFRIYLPLIKSTVEEGKQISLPAYLNGTEMILLAEDEEEVRNLTKSLLEEAGYKVIAAVDGYDTINKFMENKDNINLLLLDVIMPKKNGREAYEEIRKIRPDIKALFMSGYSESVIHQNTIIKEGLHFISKPFSQTMLLKKVREILDNSIISI
ncbi:MAG: response regulator, partial [Planctomycetota bacterium]|nr:response regulator [Planctomycetota bacterium]